jgi:hypothetical protein
VRTHFAPPTPSQGKPGEATDGRELTAREKFYVALSEACAPSHELPLGRMSVDQDTAGMEGRGPR